MPEDEYNLKIRENAQARHIEGTKEYAAYVEKAAGTGFVPSKLALNVDAQEPVEEFHGTNYRAISGQKLRQITTVRGEEYYCKPLHFAEDEEDWAYSFYTPDYPTKYFILECNFIEHIEEISEDEWTRHLHAN